MKLIKDIESALEGNSVSVDVICFAQNSEIGGADVIIEGSSAAKWCFVRDAAIGLYN